MALISKNIVSGVALFAVALVVVLLLSSATSPSPSTKYRVEAIYLGTDFRDAKAIKRNGGFIEDVSTVLVPSRDYSRGQYNVSITRVGSTKYYRIDGTNYYIETASCYKSASREKVVLNITSPSSGYNIGEIIFF